MPNAEAVLTSTQEDTLLNEWLPYIRAVVRKCGVPFCDRDDIVQGIMLDIVEGPRDPDGNRKHPAGYLDIFDPNKGSMRTFLWAMVQKRVFGRTSHHGRDAMRHAFTAGEDTWQFERETLKSGPQKVMDHEEQKAFWDRVKKVREKITARRPRRPRKNSDGTTTPRHDVNVFDLLVAGKPQFEIARELGYSEATISVVVASIRNDEEVKDILGTV